MKYYGKLLDPKDLVTKEYTDNTLSASLGYTDEQSAATLTAAKNYTDNYGGKIDTITVNSGSTLPIVDKNVDIPITKSTVGLDNVDNKSEATIKSDFTGSIASGNGNFVTGGAVYTALQNKQDVIQVSTMPEASSIYEDKVYQFIGTTTSSYTSGAFYKCVGTSTYSHAIQAYGSTSMEGSSYNANFTISNNSETLIDNYNSILTTLISKGYIRPNILQATGYFYFGGYTNIGGLYVDNRETPNVISLIDEDLEGALAWISPEGNLIADTVTAITTYSWQQVTYSKSELDITLSNKADKTQLDDIVQTLVGYINSKIDGAMNQQY